MRRREDMNLNGGNMSACLLEFPALTACIIQVSIQHGSTFFTSALNPTWQPLQTWQQ